MCLYVCTHKDCARSRPCKIDQGALTPSTCKGCLNYEDNHGIKQNVPAWSCLC